MPGTYDPQLNTIYWGTSNPAPDFDGGPPGDDLYTDCVLALDPDTGKLKWYFQFTPHDLLTTMRRKLPFWSMRATRASAKAARGSESQRLFIRAGPHQWGNFYRLSFRGKTELGKGNRRAGQADSNRRATTAEGMRTLPRFTGATKLVLAFLQSLDSPFSISWRRKLRSLLFEARGVSEGKTY